MNIKEEADKQSQEFMNRLVKMSPMHKADKTLYEATRLNYVSGFMAGAKVQEEIDNKALYDHDEVQSLLHKFMQSEKPDWHGYSTAKWFEQNQKPLN